MDTQEVKIILEAALLTSQTPMSVKALRQLFHEDVIDAETIRASLEMLRQDWAERGLTLIDTASGWRFQSAALMRPYLERMNPEKAPRYSRAVLETLAIIAYRQPVTRGDIEEIRGVTVSTSVLKTLEERGWVETIGHREAPGRPALLATTRTFLSDLGLRSLEELPSLDGRGAVPEVFELQFGDAEQNILGSSEEASSAQLSLDDAIQQTSGESVSQIGSDERTKDESAVDKQTPDLTLELLAVVSEEGSADTETSVLLEESPIDGRDNSLQEVLHKNIPKEASETLLEDDSSHTESAAAT